ncbi:hypothetical protein NG99_12775 [Erwinia typographi]|uniref:Fimbrial chaperone protein n=1 Tax=Erwinia typographi TaxID=371042 RepID=A0A0A3Z588_9GAMM|nr:fimbria/pilus periplasmic chaperone [Erwinia typographi]KGT92816.1 hypothetical protein NG99_12775 [Erwinia typographi]
MKYISLKLFGCGLLCAFSLLSASVSAGGISLGGTRVVYPADAAQTTISVANQSDASTYLIQSWVEKADGTKTSDFIVTPPLYTSAPGNENVLRIISGGAPHARDRETLYYFNVKAIPSVNKKAAEGSPASLVVATVMQIKLFVRPPGLKPARQNAADNLAFTRKGEQLVIRNPTPYYLTLSGMKVGSQALTDVMVPPQGTGTISLPTGSGNTVTWQSINDYGGLDKGQSRIR